jgi:hypothetical protein
MDQASVTKIVLFGLLLVGIALLVVRILKPFINYVENRIFEKQTAKAVAKMRDGKKDNKPIAVRQTDISTNMSREDRNKYRHAENLAFKGQVQEAAAIFESIKFQRKAIDILEAAGFIDDACAVLRRLNAIGRAGVVYERHQMLEKAAHCYSLANQNESAGKVFCRLAINDYRFYISAYEAFAKDGKWDAMLSAASEVLASTKIVEVALTRNKADFLGTYLANDRLAQATFPHLSDSQISTFFTTLPSTPRFVAYARSWADVESREHVDVALLTFVSQKSELCKFFWTDLKSDARARLSAIVTHSTLLSAAARDVHSQYIKEEKTA